MTTLTSALGLQVPYANVQPLKEEHVKTLAQEDLIWLLERLQQLPDDYLVIWVVVGERYNHIAHIGSVDPAEEGYDDLPLAKGEVWATWLQLVVSEQGLWPELCRWAQENRRVV